MLTSELFESNLTEASPLGKMGFPKNFIRAVYSNANLDYDTEPVPLEGKPKAADFKNKIVVAKGRDGKMYAVRYAESDSGRDGAIFISWDHENGTTDPKYMTFTQALAPMKSGTEFWTIDLASGWNRGRAKQQSEVEREKLGSIQDEVLDYMNQTFLPKLKGQIEQYLDYIYANLRKLKNTKDWSYGKTEQEQALASAKSLENIAAKGFNRETVEEFLRVNERLTHGWGSFYTNRYNFAELMNTKPAARAEFAKMVFGTAKSLYQEVKDMVQKPVVDALSRESVGEDSDPCWKGYKQVGMKDKAGKQVPNCVPKEGVAEGEVVPFPKKEKPKAKPVHCPKCGGEMQSGKMDGQRVKVCVPCLTYVKDNSVDEGKWHVSPSGVKTNMSPTDDDYDINYGKGGGVAKFRKSQGLDVKTGAKKDVEEGIKDKVAAGLTAAALAAAPASADAAPSVAGVIASQTAARHAAAAREKPSAPAPKQQSTSWSDILKAITSNVKSSR